MHCKYWLVGLVLALGLPGAGCQRNLVETPHLLRGRNPASVFEFCPADCQQADVPVLYATDRANEAPPGQPPTYGPRRGGALAFGVVNVSLKPNPSWQELIQDSTQPTRSRDYALALAAPQEAGQFRIRRGEPITVSASSIVQAKATLEEAINDRVPRNEFQQILMNRLAQTQQKEVFIFVHGYNNTFDDGIFRAAEVWHFMGRIGVPVAYTWPAGWGGIRGYAYDRESGEFTVTHLRRFIKTIAECPGVERIHLIAHSRGTDVTITALRELYLGYHAQGKSTQQELKLENLVLAAPDLDEEVFMQRFIGENLARAANRTTIYASVEDKAIELTDIIFASRRRLGVLVAKDFNPKLKRALTKMPNVNFIECKVSGSYWTHDYVFTNPAALSDLILLLRDRRPPGAEYGRPLHQPAEGGWELREDYLAPPTSRLGARLP
jgi:esterase/lipase superfamily enzyme